MLKQEWSLLVFLLICLSLGASPRPLHFIPVSSVKNSSFQTDVFFAKDSIVYAVDNKKGIIKAWDWTSKSFLQPLFTKLPIGAVADDITGGEYGLYVLDSKKSSIYVYNYQGILLRTIDFSSSPAVKFKKAIRILVNFQNYIYVLDAGRNELFAFTNEGMFLGNISINAPLSMCLGQDQLLYILQNIGANQEVKVVNQNLASVRTFKIQTPDTGKDVIADIAINQFNEFYVIYLSSTSISKIDAKGKIIPKSTWGSQGKGESLNTFLAPTVLKTAVLQGAALIGIWDKQTKLIKLYTDSEFSNQQMLESPPLTMRPALEETQDPVCYDSAISDSLGYYLCDLAASGGGNKLIRTIVRKTKGTSQVITNTLVNSKQGMKGMDGFAIYQSKLFVLDTKACQVFVFDKVTGSFVNKFSAKGTIPGRLSNPRSIATSKDGLVFVADYDNYRISVFDEYGMFNENIDLKKDKLKPQLLRIDSNNLLLLANDKYIYTIPLTNYKAKTLLLTGNNISSFDMLYENRLGYIEAESQQLVVTLNGKKEATYFAFSSKAQFPGFGNISHIRYNPADKTLLIGDKLAKFSRILRFYYSPKKPKTVYLSLNQQLQAELYWEVTEGITKWVVSEESESGIVSHNVTQPKYLIPNPQNSLRRYRICSIAEDGKQSPPSEEIEDAYSYARYLVADHEYQEAIKAYVKAACSISDKRLDDEIVKTYVAEANHYIRTLEYDKALKSMQDAIAKGGQRTDLILATVEIYKLMSAYKQGITYLEGLQNVSDKDIARQMISLQHLNKNSLAVKNLAQAWIAKNGKDKDVSMYLAVAHENLQDYSAALAVRRDLLSLDDTFANNLKIGELLIRTKQNQEALNHLNRVLTLYKNEQHDATYKLMGDAYFALQNYSYAADAYNNAIRENSENAELYYCVALAYLELHHANESLTNFAKAYRLDKSSFTYGFAYAKALEKMNRFPEAMAVLDEIYNLVSEDASSAEFHTFYYDLLTREKRYDDAYREIELAVKFAPDDIALFEKLEEATQTREFYNREKDAVEIRDITFFPVYPSLQEYYLTNPIGTITLFNNRNISIQDVQVMVKIPRITDKPFETTVSTLIPNKEHQIDIIVPISANIFNICCAGSETIPTEVFVEYSFDGRSPQMYDNKKTITVLGNSAMNWQNRKQFASFINPNDENLRSFVSRSIVPLFANDTSPTVDKNLQKAMQIWSFYQANGISFIADNTASNLDSSEIDYVQYPFQTLDRKVGDCEDLVALMAASLSVIGVECGFIDIPGHVILAFQTDMSYNNILETGIDSNKLILRNGKCWIPLEATILGKEGLLEGWTNAATSYLELVKKGIMPELIEFSEANKLYQPAKWTLPIPETKYANTLDAQKYFRIELENIKIMGQQAQEAEFLQTLKKYPDNITVANQYAIWCIQNNRLTRAQNIWEQILEKDPRNQTALINLGNMLLEAKLYDQARTYYINAIKLVKDPDELICNLCILEYRCGNMAKAKEYFNRLTNQNSLKEKDNKAYADLLHSGE